MTQVLPPDAAERPAAGLEGILLTHRAELVQFLRAHGAGDLAEDLMQELWIRVRTSTLGPIARPLSYLYRAANNLMIEQSRSRRRAEQRERDWGDTLHVEGVVPDAPAERAIMSREAIEGADAALAALGTRVATVFRRYRLDRVAQRDIAAELGVSLSTVESDLRKAYRALVAYRRSLDEA